MPYYRCNNNSPLSLSVKITEVKALLKRTSIAALAVTTTMSCASIAQSATVEETLKLSYEFENGKVFSALVTGMRGDYMSEDYVDMLGTVGFVEQTDASQIFTVNSVSNVKVDGATWVENNNPGSLSAGIVGALGGVALDEMGRVSFDGSLIDIFFGDVNSTDPATNAVAFSAGGPLQFLLSSSIASGQGDLFGDPSIGETLFFDDSFNVARYSLAPVPLPTGLVLLVSGVASMSIMRRRK